MCLFCSLNSEDRFSRVEADGYSTKTINEAISSLSLSLSLSQSKKNGQKEPYHKPSFQSFETFFLDEILARTKVTEKYSMLVLVTPSFGLTRTREHLLCQFVSVVPS